MKDYVGDRGSPISHVAAELEGAESALSVSDLAEGYRHPVTGDITRVKRHIETDSNAKATEYLVAQALKELEFRGTTPKSRRQLAVENDTYRLIIPFDELQWNGRKIHRREADPYAVADWPGEHDPFNPQSGTLSENIRRPGNLDDLRESMRRFGWLPHHPAVKDEHGVILVGHRRLAAAAELRAEGISIEDDVREHPCGKGDVGDAERFRLAIGSNEGNKPLTKTDRKRLAEHLYGADWRLERIAQALSVSISTISSDLSGVEKKKRQGVGDHKPKITPEQIVEHSTVEAAMNVVQEPEPKLQCVCPDCGTVHERKA